MSLGFGLSGRPYRRASNRLRTPHLAGGRNFASRMTRSTVLGRALLAQVVEQLTLNQRVQGSSPWRRTTSETASDKVKHFLNQGFGFMVCRQTAPYSVIRSVIWARTAPCVCVAGNYSARTLSATTTSEVDPVTRAPPPSPPMREPSPPTHSPSPGIRPAPSSTPSSRQLVADLTPCGHRNLAFHTGKPHPNGCFALTIREAPADPHVR